DDYAGPLAFDDFAGDLRRVLDHYGARRAHLVGLSMGGRIAMRFFFLHPQRVATLTLCDTHRGFASLTAEQRAEYVRLRREVLDAELTVIPDAGHLSNIENAEVFNRSVMDFLLRHPGADSPRAPTVAGTLGQRGL